MFAHVFIWMVVCLITQPNMPLDMVEMLLWGQQWQLGYHKHPPLPAWTAAIAWEIGGQQPWCIYLVAQLTVVATFWAVWQFAREFLTPWIALASVVVLEGCYYCTYMISDLNNTIITRPMWALTILFLYRALTHKRSNRYWCATGVVIGLGMLSKYYIAVLVVCLLTTPLFLPQTRKHLRTVGPYLTTTIAFLIFLPHLIWMVQNDFITIRYALQRSGEAAQSAAFTDALSDQQNSGLTKHLYEPFRFAFSQIGAILPVYFLALPLVLGMKGTRKPLSQATFPATGKSNSAPTSIPTESHIAKDRFYRTYLKVAFLGPIVVYLAIGLLAGASIRSAWGGPLFSYLGVFYLAHCIQVRPPAKIDKRYAQAEFRWSRFVIRNSLIIGLLFVIALAGRNVLGPSARGKPSRVHFPGKEASRLVNEEWDKRYTAPLPLVGGELFISGCVGVYSRHPVDVYAALSPHQNPWTDDEEFNANGGVIVWDWAVYGENPPDGWLKRFQRVEQLGAFRCSTLVSGDHKPDVEIGIAIIHPLSAKMRSCRHHRTEGTTRY